MMTEYEYTNQGPEKIMTLYYFAEYKRHNRCQSQQNELTRNDRRGCLQLHIAAKRGDFDRTKMART